MKNALVCLPVEMPIVVVVIITTTIYAKTALLLYLNPPAPVVSRGGAGVRETNVFHQGSW